MAGRSLSGSSFKLPQIRPLLASVLHHFGVPASLYLLVPLSSGFRPSKGPCETPVVDDTPSFALWSIHAAAGTPNCMIQYNGLHCPLLVKPGPNRSPQRLHQSMCHTNLSQGTVASPCRRTHTLHTMSLRSRMSSRLRSPLSPRACWIVYDTRVTVTSSVRGKEGRRFRRSRGPNFGGWIA